MKYKKAKMLCSHRNLLLPRMRHGRRETPPHLLPPPKGHPPVPPDTQAPWKGMEKGLSTPTNEG